MSDDELRLLYGAAQTWDAKSHTAGLRAVERAARAAAFDEAIALALQHAEAAKRTDDAASSLRLLVTKLRARAEAA